MTKIAALGLLIGCGAPMGEDAGSDASEMSDSGQPRRDSGFDAALHDAGPEGCIGTGCGFVELASGTAHVCGRRENGEVMCWGRNQGFQLGDGRERHQSCGMAETGLPADCSSTPVGLRYDDGTGERILDDADALSARGFTSSCVLRAGELWCWSEDLVPAGGAGIVSLSGVARRAYDSRPPTLQASVSEFHSCVISGTGRELDCIGRNAYGQLGNGAIAEQTRDFSRVLLDPTATPPTELDGVSEVLVSFGGFTCARTADDVYCWGLDSSGQIGHGDTSAESCLGGTGERFDCARSPRVVGGDAAPIGATIDLAVGSSHACAITGGGSAGPVVCWGDNRNGQLARADTVESSSVPMPVAGLADATQVEVGFGTSYALHADGTISAWGFNQVGQLGDGTMSHGAACTTGMETGDCARAPVTVDGITDAAFIVASSSHACAIHEDGSVSCWGSNTNRELGDGTRDTRFSPVQVLGTAP